MLKNGVTLCGLTVNGGSPFARTAFPIRNGALRTPDSILDLVVAVDTASDQVMADAVMDLRISRPDLAGEIPPTVTQPTMTRTFLTDRAEDCANGELRRSPKPVPSIPIQRARARRIPSRRISTATIRSTVDSR